MLSIIRTTARRTINLLIVLVLAVALALVSFVLGMAIADSAMNMRAPRMIPLVWVI